MDNSDCTSCHSGATPSTTSNITSNIPSSGYVPGNIYNITAVSNTGSVGPDPNGFEVTCEENTSNTKTGAFLITNANTTQFVNNNNAVTHTAAGNSLNTWSFDWEAPVAGTGDITFYGAFIEAGYPFGQNFSDYFSSTTLSVIVVHLKAGSTGEDANRRFASCEELEGYVVSHLNDNIIILGDYNDEITDPESSNSLWPLVNSNSVEFTTESIANIDYYASYPSWPSFIDHISVSQQLFDEMVGSSIKTIRIDDYTGYTNFQNNFSDHRPVIWSFPLDAIDVPTGLVINEIMQNPSAVSDTYGEWIEVTNIGDETINLDGLILHEDGGESHTINILGGLFLLPEEFMVLGINDDISQNGGITVVYEYSDFFLSNSWDEVIISHPSGIIIDQISYDNGISFPDESGMSMALNSPLNDNSLGENWIISSNQLPSGDYGTPGAPNTTGSCSVAGNGDVNDDGILNILDLVSIIQFILGEIEFSQPQLCSADRNFDSVINILDIVQIVSDILDN